eukprot:TRINITY_DN18356_c0_g2_i1.p1 TRINITY_DN18356_c0_g2~~TRINITY_DN18356_c0_g2_i1.p1  ORF type:complete len:222 (-),score=48.48 TRINITY_DN18356_c0_g2_i1:259-834(-)
MPVVVHTTEVLEGGLIQSGSVLSTEAIGECTLHGTMSLAAPSRNVHDEHIEKSYDVGGKEAYKGHNGDYSILPSADTIEFEDVDLGGSLVDPEKNEVHFIAFRKNKNRSFKKKLRDVFTSKKQSARRKDSNFEQVEIWFDDFDLEAAEQRGGISTSSTTLRNLDTKKLTSQDFCESDWELVEVGGIYSTAM